jgi:hypothetical protein
MDEVLTQATATIQFHPRRRNICKYKVAISHATFDQNEAFFKSEQAAYSWINDIAKQRSLEVTAVTVLPPTDET